MRRSDGAVSDCSFVQSTHRFYRLGLLRHVSDDAQHALSAVAQPCPACDSAAGVHHGLGPVSAIEAGSAVRTDEG